MGCGTCFRLQIQVKELEGQLAESRCALEAAPPQQAPSAAGNDAASQADASAAAADMVNLVTHPCIAARVTVLQDAAVLRR
jgi:hypothetical protein